MSAHTSVNFFRYFGSEVMTQLRKVTQLLRQHPGAIRHAAQLSCICQCIKKYWEKRNLQNFEQKWTDWKQHYDKQQRDKHLKYIEDMIQQWTQDEWNTYLSVAFNCGCDSCQHIVTAAYNTFKQGKINTIDDIKDVAFHNVVPFETMDEDEFYKQHNIMYTTFK